MPDQPTVESLHVAALKALGIRLSSRERAGGSTVWIVIGLGQLAPKITWGDTEQDAWRIAKKTHPLTRDLIFNLESKLLVSWKDRRDYMRALAHIVTLSPDKMVGAISCGLTPYEIEDWLMLNASPEACLRALHAIGKLEVK